MFYKIINDIKMGYKRNSKMMCVQIQPKDLKIIKIMINFGILKKIVKINLKNYLIFFNYVNKNKVFYNIQNMYRPSHKKFIKLKDLKKITLNKKYILILSTNLGLINSVEATKYNIGGLIIAKIWN